LSGVRRQFALSCKFGNSEAVFWKEALGTAGSTLFVSPIDRRFAPLAHRFFAASRRMFTGSRRIFTASSPVLAACPPVRVLGGCGLFLGVCI
jgi:hypothetical protein